MNAPLYVYLCYGPSPAAERELRYSFETLRAEIGGDASKVAIYTDRPHAFDDLGAEIVDATEIVSQARALKYLHRAKPMALVDALRRFGRPCALMDLDSFIRPGFAKTVERALAQGAAMNQFVRADAYPDIAEFEADLPHLGRYKLDHAKSAMLNSGLVAATPAHLPLLEDALVLIDALRIENARRHDIEQFAIAETLRLGGVRIAMIDAAFEHYCQRWSKRYMRRRLRRRRADERIPLSKARARLFKAYWTLRLAMRNARRLRGAAVWRKI